VARAARRWILAGLLVACAGTGDAGDEGPVLPDAAAIPGTWVRSDYTRASGLLDAPFPSADRAVESGARVDDWPGARANPYTSALVDLIHERRDGFAQTAGIHFALTAPLAEVALDDPKASLASEARAFIVDVDSTSPQLGARHPLTGDFRVDPGPYGAANLLTLLPVQGIPLRPRTRYAAVVTRALRDHGGAPLGRPPELADLLAGRPVQGLEGPARAAYDEALRALVAAGLDPADIAGLAVFRTGDAAHELADFVSHARRLPPLTPSAFTPREVYEDFCVFEAEVALPVYQHGAPPYLGDLEAGGGWRRDAAGEPQLHGHAAARLFLTVPRQPAPPSGYPALVFIRTGGGGDRPLIDRGVRAVAGGEAIEPGSGPARNLARAGLAGVQVDGPHGGPRNVAGEDEQFLMFNLTNLRAMRDNVRQAALEITLLADLVPQLVVDASTCPGASAEARLDGGALGLMGHSMGAWIAPLALASAPRYHALALSGAGGSWIENIVHKERPIPPRPFVESLLGYAGRSLHSHDPALTLVQWALESADTALYGPLVAATEAHVLMLQGVVDAYQPPPLANATSLSLGLDLALPALDATHPDLAAFRPLAADLPLVGLGALPYPIAGNRLGARTRVVAQHPEDDVEDGHEVAYQTEGPKHQYRCFFASWAAGLIPVVPAPEGEWAPCPDPP